MLCLVHLPEQATSFGWMGQSILASGHEMGPLVLAVSPIATATPSLVSGSPARQAYTLRRAARDLRKTLLYTNLGNGPKRDSFQVEII